MSEVECRHIATRARPSLQPERSERPKRIDAEPLARLMAELAAGGLTKTLEIHDTDGLLLRTAKPITRRHARPS